MASARPELDSLAYLDTELDAPGMRDRVTAAVAAEMRGMPRRDYLADRAAYEPSFSGSALLQAEWARVRGGEKMAPFDTQRYECAPPTGAAAEDPVAWAEATGNVLAQLQAQRGRTANLQLLHKYGANAWRAHNRDLEGVQRCVERRAAELAAEAEAVNVRRTRAQHAVVPELRKLAVQLQQSEQAVRAVEAAVRSVDGGAGSGSGSGSGSGEPAAKRARR